MNEESLVEWLENMINKRLDPIVESLNRFLEYDKRFSPGKDIKPEAMEQLKLIVWSLLSMAILDKWIVLITDW